MFGELAKNVRRTKFVRRATDISSPHFHPCSAYKQRTNFPSKIIPFYLFYLILHTHTPLLQVSLEPKKLPWSFLPGFCQNTAKHHHKPPHLHLINNLEPSTTKSTPEESRISFRNKVVIDLYFEDMNSVIIIVMNFIAMSGQASHMTIR